MRNDFLFLLFVVFQQFWVMDQFKLWGAMCVGNKLANLAAGARALE
tara:strand:- start:239 stop:376 length:138 start_codon:yes stop_codon:yes gene_type:complete